MPKITAKQIEFKPSDRYLIGEVSPGMTPATFVTLFNGTIQEGNTTQYYKFLEEITEKDPDIQQSIASRTSEITSKEWVIEGPSQTVAEELEGTLRNIKGNPGEGLLTVDQLINAFLGSSYLTGISANEIVSDGKEILGFNHIPSHFLTFQDSVYYPKLYTAENPTGVEFNRQKMIMHYLNPGNDVVRGFLGHSVGIQYALKLQTLEQRIAWQRKYGKGFLLVTMPGDKDSYEKAWSNAEDLVDNLYNVDGAVFPADTEAEFKNESSLQGEYFFTAQEDYKKNIVKIVLGQDSTSSSEDSNRSTAQVHQETLDARILEDMELISDTINKQLLNKILQMKSISEDENYEFKFVVSELEATLDEDMDTEVTEDSQKGETQNGQGSE